MIRRAPVLASWTLLTLAAAIALTGAAFGRLTVFLLAAVAILLVVALVLAVLAVRVRPERRP